jgi:hypothetical protein
MEWRTPKLVEIACASVRTRFTLTSGAGLADRSGTAHCGFQKAAKALQEVVGDVPAIPLLVEAQLRRPEFGVRDDGVTAFSRARA